MPSAPDIEVELRFLTTEEGGRNTPVLTGYRPQFSYDGFDWDAEHNYGQRDSVAPGETVKAYLTFMSPEYHLGRIYLGMPFLIREGHRTVAIGYITNILNLPSSAQQSDSKQPKRYIKYVWSEDRGDEHASWGGATYYHECQCSGYTTQQIEIYDNGFVLLYDDLHAWDRYGMLSDKPFNIGDLIQYEISSEEFRAIRQAIQPYNRGAWKE